MDLYRVRFDLKPGVRDAELADDLASFLDHLVAADRIASRRHTRRKLGFGRSHLGELHLIMEVRDLVQLQGAFQEVGARTGAVEALHAAVNQHVTDFQAALYRDFPDEFRQRGDERF